MAALSGLTPSDKAYRHANRYYWQGNDVPADRAIKLILFADKVSAPGWPKEHGHLTDFALRFLEADVMLFRSGYVKRHLLCRLRQARLDLSQAERAVSLVKRAVTDGSGLEEHREFRRLAARIRTDDLITWLNQRPQCGSDGPHS